MEDGVRERERGRERERREAASRTLVPPPRDGRLPAHQGGRTGQPPGGPSVETTFDALDELAITTIRTLAMDAVQRANSGHPGTPMALAPVAHLLFTRYLKHNPTNPSWPDRDRFVLSCGHASMLLYSVLHLTGYDLGLEDLESFRQWGSRTPGHPELGEVPGVEVTTGPLGQGCASVGGHGARRGTPRGPLQPARPHRGRPPHLGAVLRRRPDGGCVERGRVARRPPAARQAGVDLGRQPHHHRGDDGPGVLARTSSGGSRPTAGGCSGSTTSTTWRRWRPPWRRRSQPTDRPTLIAVRTHIAFGAPTKQDTADAHGAPLGEDEVRGHEARLRLARRTPTSWSRKRSAIAAARATVVAPRRPRGPIGVAAWRGLFPELADEWQRRLEGELPERLAGDAAGVRGRRQGDGDPGRLGQGAQRDRR